jgi:hypothetical protein
MPALWPLAIAVGLFLAVLARILPAPSARTTVGILAAVALAIAVIVSIAELVA